MRGAVIVETQKVKAAMTPRPSFTPLRRGLLQRKCACGGTPGPTGECAECRKKRLQRKTQNSELGTRNDSSVPAIVHEVLRSPGQPLEAAIRAFMEPRFGHDFSRVNVHADERAAASAQAVNALAYTVGNDIVFGAGQYAPNDREGKRLIAHELTHTIQQSRRGIQRVTKISQPGDAHEQEADRVAEQIEQGKEPVNTSGDNDPRQSQAKPLDTCSEFGPLQRQAEDEEPQPQAPEEEGIEIGDQAIMMRPRLEFVPLPAAEDSPFMQPGGPAMLQRQPAAATSCPMEMRKVISGKFEGGKTLDDYYPDLVGRKVWGKNDTAGPFDNGERAGSAVQLIGQYAAPCRPDITYTLAQSAMTKRFRINGKKAMENGKAFEGTTFDDLKRSARDHSKPPFRQEFGFAVTMADPISGAPYSTLTSYEFEVNLTSSITGPDGTKSVDWGVTIEASGGKVTKNEVR
jgi:Domain of unknown function (DUF4157)